jgi:hypothetical protein
VAYKAFRPEPSWREARLIQWRELRLFLILLIPWAVAEIISIVYYTLCYSS